MTEPARTVLVYAAGFLLAAVPLLACLAASWGLYRLVHRLMHGRRLNGKDR